jgi:hypothetical protein
MIIGDSWSAQSGGYGRGGVRGSEMISHVVPERVCGSSFFIDRVRAWTARSRSGRSSSTGLQNRVRGIEVAVGEVVAHRGDLPPRDRWLRGQQIVRQCFDNLPISSRRMRMASTARPLDRPPRCGRERMA